LQGASEQARPDDRSDPGHVCFPAWWIHAFEASSVQDDAGSKTDSVTSRILRSGVVPNLSPAELASLGFLLVALQERLLDTRDLSGIDITPDELVKRAPAGSASGRAMVERLITVLGSLRVCSRPVAGRVSTVPIFEAESWTSEGPELLQLRYAPNGPELLLGLADGHCLLLERSIRGASAPDVFSLIEQQPLAVAPAALLELAPLEQVVLLRMEKAMQWDFRWLQLDGVFGASIDELLGGLRPGGSRGDPSSLGVRLKLLSKIGRRLVDQGVVTRLVAPQYLAFSGSGMDLQLIWQATSKTLSRISHSSWQERAGRTLVKARLIPNIRRIARILKAEQQIEDILAVEKCLADEANHLMIPLAGPGSGIAAHAAMLWLEWRARKTPGHLFELPESFRSHVLLRQVVGSTSASAEALVSFMAAVRQHSAEAAELASGSGASLAAPGSRGFPGLAEWLDRSTMGATSLAGASSTSAAQAAKATSQAQQVFPDPPVRSSSVANMQSRMRKTASEELARIKASQPAAYGELKRNYINSLDESARSLILEVQSRMLPQLFEEHLKQRLIRYMVENPAAWSASTSAQPSRIN
jgi:hypothetical protein